MNNSTLNVNDHSRESAGLRYVYPVISRRSQGVSIGINLNTNNACNWACQYCQVPGLIRGAAPQTDVSALKLELRDFLDDVLDGDFMLRRVPEGLRRLNDIAFSGNGEPTASPNFAEAVEAVLEVISEKRFPDPLKIVVISNGSFVTRDPVQQALKRLAGHRAELWFKLDRGTTLARQHVNGIEIPNPLVIERLVAASQVMPVWLQTCIYKDRGAVPSSEECEAFEGLVDQAIKAGARLQGLLLYTLARPSLQPGGEDFSAMNAEEMAPWADPIKRLGLRVQISI